MITHDTMRIQIEKIKINIPYINFRIWLSNIFVWFQMYKKLKFGLEWYTNISNLMEIISSISQKSFQTFVLVKMTRSARSKKLNKNLSHRKSKLLSAMLKTCYKFDNEKWYVLFSNNFIYSRLSIITIIFKHETIFKNHILDVKQTKL